MSEEENGDHFAKVHSFFVKGKPEFSGETEAPVVVLGGVLGVSDAVVLLSLSCG